MVAPKTLVVSLVLASIDYCNSLLAGLPTVIGKLQRVQNSAAHLVVRAPPHVHITPILRHIQWLPVKAQMFYKIACYHLLHPCLSLPNLLHQYTPSRSLRSSADTSLLKIPLWKCKKKGDRTFPYFGPSVWNSLPLHIRNSTTIDTFKSALKTYLFNLQESD